VEAIAFAWPLAKPTMQHLIEVLMSGLVSGCYYAALATALSLVFGISKIVNFAHGEFVMVGGFCYLLGLPYVGPLGAEVFAFFVPAAIALLFHGLIFRRRSLASTDALSLGEYQLITTFALGMFLLNLVLMLFGPEIRSVSAALTVPRIRTEFFSISSERLAGLLQCVALLLAVHLFLAKTSIGRLLRAASQNANAISTLGVDSERFERLAFSAGCGLAGLAGAFIAPVFSVYPESGAVFALKCFVVVVLGGFGSFTGTIAGGLLLGVIEAFSGALISTAYKDAFGFLTLLVVLFIRPHGLSGERARGV
jgi:branched-chain amino acid transport system permease protein